MAIKARTPVDVILGEATYGTNQQRYNDMLNIASVIANRAAQLNVSPQQVVGVRSEFNAYGKSLPKGANNYRSLAERAWQQVKATGPVHNATFYATPAASKNLPSGLQKVAQTSGHIYYTDPKNRSIRTTEGFIKPQAQAALPATAPIPTAAPRGVLDSQPVGMAALAPNGLLGQQAGADFYNRGQSNIQGGLLDALTGTSAELGQRLGITSGYRSPEYNRSVGGARNSMHTRGMAADIDMRDMSIPERQQLVQEMAQRGAGGFITYSRSPDMLHVDMRERPDGTNPHFMHDRTAARMDNAPGWFQEMAQVGGVRNPDTGPVPQSRPDPSLASPLEAAPSGTVERGLLAAPVMADIKQAGAVTDTLEAAPAGMVERSGLAPVQEPTFQAEIAPAGTMAASLDPVQTGMVERGLLADPVQAQAQPQAPAGLLAPTPQPTVTPAPPMAQPREIRDYPVFSAPQQAPVAAPEAPATPSGMHAISGLFGAPAGAMAVSQANPDISFTSLGNGYVQKTNQFGNQSILSPWDYSHPSTPGPRADYGVPQGLQSAIQAPQQTEGFMGIPEARTKLGQTVRGGVGGMAGAAVGGLLGPVGAVLGGLLGRELAQGHNPFDAFSRQQTTSALGNSTSNVFPDAPSPSLFQGPAGGGDYSHASWDSLSPSVQDAISNAPGGLY